MALISPESTIKLKNTAIRFTRKYKLHIRYLRQMIRSMFRSILMAEFGEKIQKTRKD